MSQEKKEDNPSQSVSAAVCAARHEALSEKLRAMELDVLIVRKALVGEDLRGGLVSEFQDYKTHCNNRFNELASNINNKLSGKDRAVIYAALIAAVAAVLTAMLR